MTINIEEKVEAVKHFSKDGYNAVKDLVKLLEKKKRLNEKLNEENKRLNRDIDGYMEYIKMEFNGIKRVVKNDKKTKKK